MYEVYALKYAERDTTACQFFYREASHAPLTLHYYVGLILGGPHPILVDTGFLDDDARERGMRRPGHALGHGRVPCAVRDISSGRMRWRSRSRSAASTYCCASASFRVSISTPDSAASGAAKPCRVMPHTWRDVRALRAVAVAPRTRSGARRT